MSEICTECLRGQVTPTSGEGRTFTYRRGSTYELPATFQVPTCDACRAMFLDDELREAAREALRPAYQADQRAHLEFLIETIREKAKVTNREIEQACGVTPTYLSHVLKGRKEASEPLIGLLEGFAIYPAEVKRRLGRNGSHDTESVRLTIEGQCVVHDGFRLADYRHLPNEGFRFVERPALPAHGAFDWTETLGVRARPAPKIVFEVGPANDVEAA